MKTSLGLAVVFGVLAFGGNGLAGTPFGGDDTGFFPPGGPKGTVARCENYNERSWANLFAAVTRCHARRVSGSVATEAREEACEQDVNQQFDDRNKICTPCSEDNRGPAKALAETILNMVGGDIYCAAGTPFGGDDMGAIPTDAPHGPVAQCERRVAGALSKLVKRLAGCEFDRVRGRLADEAAEDACEAAAVVKFGATNTHSCAPCTNLANLALVGEAVVDGGVNALVYCASPSGAFVDGGRVD